MLKENGNWLNVALSLSLSLSLSLNFLSLCLFSSCVRQPLCFDGIQIRKEILWLRILDFGFELNEARRGFSCKVIGKTIGPDIS